MSEGETVVEGGTELVHGGASSRVFATVMVTADLGRLADRFRDRPDAATAARVAELLEGHPDLAPKLASRIRARLPELAGDPAAVQWEVVVDANVRAEGTEVLIDADIVAAPTGVEVG